MSRSGREARQRALEEALREKRTRTRRIRILAAGAAVVVLAGAGIAVGLGVSKHGSGTGLTGVYDPLSSLGSLQADPDPGTIGPENVPIPAVSVLADTSKAATGQTVDGISCDTSEQTVFHIHTHLTIFVNGKQQQIPAGIGIPGAVTAQTSGGPFVESGTCFYWLHTHAADGIVHIESPTQRTFTLGNFFDEWGQPLSATQVGPAKGKVTAIVNGKVFVGDPQDVPLGSHENLTLEVGTPLVQPSTIDWSRTKL
jgi:hypothetical protein